MAASDVASSLRVVMDLASAVLRFSENWSTASKEWQDFPRQVDNLKRKCDSWQEQVIKFGLSSDRALIDPLNEARALLQQEVEKISKRKGKSAAGPMTKLHMTAFPSKLGQSIQRVTQAFNDILNNLKDEKEVKAESKKKALENISSLGFRKDKRYIALDETETAIKTALENPEGPAVVLLHGAPGKGKSSVARNVALHYKLIAEESRAMSLRMAEVSVAGFSSSEPRSPVFQDVIYLECGPEVELLAKQLELRRYLGWDTAGFGFDGELSADHNVIANVQAALSSSLKDRRLLLVFDDLWDDSRDFLQQTVDLCGPKIRCLLTSQMKDLCTKLNMHSMPIEIEKIRLTVSRRILAAHIGLEIIPSHVQDCADDIINNVDRNPLALACIATAIDPKLADNEKEWAEISLQLTKLLAINSRDIAYIQSIQYPKSYWEAMQLAFDRLTQEQKKSLILVSICNGAKRTIPEEVIRILTMKLGVAYGKSSRSEVFSTTRKQLEERHLIRVTIAKSIGKEKSWSTHLLLERFITERKDEEKKSIFAALVPRSTFAKFVLDGDRKDAQNVPMIGGGTSSGSEDISAAVGVLYFDHEFTSMMMSKASDNVTMAKRVLRTRRNAVDPLTRLLVLDVGPHWNATVHAASKQIFLTYVLYGTINDTENNISVLLDNATSRGPVLSVLHRVSSRQRIVITKETMNVFVHILSSDNGNNTQCHGCPVSTGNPVISCACGKTREQMELVLCILANLARGHEGMKIKLFLECPTILKALVDSLARSDQPSLQWHAAQVLINLAQARGKFKERIKAEIVTYPGVLENIGKALLTQTNPDIAEKAAEFLSTLAYAYYDKEMCFKILSFRGILDGLVDALFNDGNRCLQGRATQALGNLAYDVDVYTYNTGFGIVDSPRFLEGIVKALTTMKDENCNFDLLVGALRVLTHLTYGGNQEICWKVVTFPRLLEELVKAMRQDSNHDLQVGATKVLATLAHCPYKKICFEIVKVPGALTGLVEALSNAEKPKLQVAAVTVLANLAYGTDEDMSSKIVDCPQALGRLVNSLASSGHHDLRFRAAKALTRLAFWGNKDICRTIVNFPTALDELVKALSTSDNLDLQEGAAEALANIANKCDVHNLQKICLRIASSPGALEELTKTFLKDHKGVHDLNHQHVDEETSSEDRDNGHWMKVRSALTKLHLMYNRAHGSQISQPL